VEEFQMNSTALKLRDLLTRKIGSISGKTTPKSGILFLKLIESRRLKGINVDWA
jgi:hypothetical protein